MIRNTKARYSNKLRYGSQFFVCLAAKQMLKKFYCLNERELVLIFSLSFLEYKKKKNVSLFIDFFFSLLESRLDVILYRSGFAYSVLHARQLISHGHVLLNNSKQQKPGKFKFFVMPGDFIFCNPNFTIKKQNNVSHTRILLQQTTYIEVNSKLHTIILTSLPRIRAYCYPFLNDSSSSKLISDKRVRAFFFSVAQCLIKQH
uniref:Ribosomal protein S4 n=1 Tax=Goniomonas avonlea TaxID=1255295 RepID=A0A348G6M4_9CRYP|nr:ribosomal protein S4 [Goniomonas avonlea]